MLRRRRHIDRSAEARDLRGVSLRRALALAVGLAAAPSSTSAEDASRPVTLANGEWPPYQSEALKRGGVVSHIVADAFSIGGASVRYRFLPWGRALLIAKAGEIDGTLVWFRTPARERYFYVSDPVVNVRFSLFHQKGDPFDWDDIDDLEGLTIGVLTPTSLTPEFDAAEAEGRLKVERVPTVEMNFEKLLLGRLDIVITDVEAGYDALREHFSPTEQQRLTYHPTPILAKPMHVLLSRKVPENAQNIAKLNIGLAALRASGAYEAYFKRARAGAYAASPPD